MLSVSPTKQSQIKSLEPQPEPQLQHTELIKQCKQVNKRNNCGASFDKIDKILHTLGRIELEWYEKAQTNNTKQPKETRPAAPIRNTCSVAQHNQAYAKQNQYTGRYWDMDV